MRVLVCGGRAFENYSLLHRVLCGVREEHNEFTLLHGGATGADRMAGRWAEHVGVPVVVFEAEWRKYGPSAEPIRDTRMLNVGKPDLVVAFPGATGTTDMVKLARKAGVEIMEVSERHEV